MLYVNAWWGPCVCVCVCLSDLCAFQSCLPSVVQKVEVGELFQARSVAHLLSHLAKTELFFNVM